MSGSLSKFSIPSRLRPFHMLVFSLSMLLPLFIVPPHACAQPGTLSLNAISVSDESAGGTKMLLSFDGLLPPFSITTNNNERVVIDLPSTTRGSAIKVPSRLRGVLRGVEFTELEGELRLVLVGAGPIHVDAAAIAGRALSLNVTASSDTGKNPVAAVTGITQPHVEPFAGRESFEVVPLKYADISEVVGLLSAGQAIKPNDNFTVQEPLFGSSGINSNGSLGNNALATPSFNPNVADGANTAFGQSIDDSIGVDRRLNAIILRGSPDQVRSLRAKIAALDVPVQSVLLETIFVELTETGARNVGLDFNNSSGQIAVATYQRGAFVGNGAASGVDVAGYGSYALQAAIYAQVVKGEGRIVSRPRISAQSGVSAKIVTGDALPIVTSIALSGVNAVSQQVQYVNVGVTLQIAPRVASDGFVTSHIFAEVSTVTGYSQGYPTISQREATTSATVRDGEYFIVGGLTQESHLKSRGHVPVLGDLPVAGELFKLHQESRSKTELYIVVTPHILHEKDSEGARSEIHK